MNVLITGINGFVGSTLRHTLEARGVRVYGMDLRSGDDAVHAVDITDQDAVKQRIDALRPDFIFHLAAISRVDYDNPSLLYRINVTGTLNLLIAAARCLTRPRFILVSSSQVYGIVPEERQPIGERMPMMPVNHYGASKAAAEQIARVFHYEYGLPVAIARPFNHIGRGQDPHFVIAKIIRAAREKNLDITLGNLSVTRDFLDVRDVVDAYVRMMEQFPDGGVFNIASGIGYRLSDLLETIQDISGVRFNITRAEALLRKNDIAMSVGDSTAFRQSHDWSPAHGIRETLEWILAE
ncbi:MAG: GDP-mannose 4,6-dehydratase [Spirochaetes bacterium]|nr:GDP-mannose 4,6-dehydratase [Spirochaetota bacterium]